MRLSRLAAFLPFAAAAVRAGTVGCPVFDSNFNLYVLGLEQDVNLGAQASWASASPQPLTTAGRPPFDTSNPRCYLAQFFNAIYVLGADSQNPFAVYIYDVAHGSWTTQAVDGTGGPNPADQVEILDHDTNVFYALSGGTLYFLNMNSQINATASALTWTNQDTPSFIPSGYNPTMAIAQNHIFFFGVPGSTAGDTFIFVIHFAFPQPTPQPFKPLSGSPFPVAHGQAPSLFQDSHVQEFIAFIPDDSSTTYLLDVQHNTSLPLAGPSDKTAGAHFVASETAVVQLTAAGKLFYLPISQTDTSAAASAAWTAIGGVTLAGGSSGSSATPSGSGTGTGTGAGPTGGAGTGSATVGGGTTASGSGAPSPTGSQPGAASARAGVSATLMLGAVALLAVLAF